MKIDKLKNPIKNKKTILSVGPMSQNCIDAALEISESSKIPLQFIPSRRQIESRELGGGYVNNWTTEEFSKYVKEKSTSDNIFLSRDHGGPWQNNEEKKSITTYKDALNSSLSSFKEDILSGFDFLHIDTSIDINKQISNEEATNRACELLYLCVDFAKTENREVYFEIGTELQSEEINDIKEVKENLEIIKLFCHKNKISPPFFYVIQNGAKVLEMENVGIFESETNKDFTNEYEEIKKINKICNDYGIYTKAHNSDYLSKEYSEMYPKLGINGANIAPEFGVIETLTYLEIFNNFDLSEEKEVFLNISYNSEKWQKWLKPNSTTSDYEKSVISGHYVFSSEEFQDLKSKVKTKLSHSIDIDKEIKKNIKNKINFYLESFGWFG